MNSKIKEMLFVGFALLSTACAHYPQQYSYYPDYGGYSSGYTIMHRNYYGERPNHYDHDYGHHHGRAYFPHHRQHDQYNVQRRWDNDYSAHHQRGRDYDHSFNYRNGRQHNDNHDSHRNNFDHRNHD